MKYMLPALAVGLVICVSGQAREIYHSKQEYLTIGQGYKASDQLNKSRCLEPIAEPDGTSEANISLATEVSRRHLEKSLGIQAGGKYRTGAVNVSAKADFAKATSSSGHSLSLSYKADYSFAPMVIKEYKWTPIARDLLKPKVTEGEEPTNGVYSEAEWAGVVEAKNEELFLKKCGDEFVSLQTREAKFYYNIRIDFVSDSDRRTVGANFELTSPTVDVNAQFRDKMEKVSTRTKVTVSALQIGGDISKLGMIFGKNPMNDDTGSKDFVSCSGGKYEDCFNVLQRAIAYANDGTEGFPSTLKKTEDENTGPSVTSSILERYVDVTGLTDMTSPALNKTIQQKRTDLNDAFESILQSWIRASRVQETGIPRLSADQWDIRDGVENEALIDLETLAEDYIQPCYESKFQCVQLATAEVVNRYKELATIYAKKVKFDPETFAALCDYRLAGLVSKEEAKTIDAIIAFLDKPIITDETEEEFRPISDAKDFCEAAGIELENTTKLDLSAMQLTDLSPLRFSKHLEELDLSNNRLDGPVFKVLEGFEDLATLKLTGNKMRGITKFPELKGLKQLHLNDNKLADISFLAAQAKNLTYLNISNAGRKATCPFAPEQNICVMRDYARYTSFSESPRSLSPRMGSQLVRLNDEVALIMGGLGKTTTEVMNLRNMSLSESRKKVENTHGTSFTALGDNKVLMFGGLLDFAEQALVIEFKQNGKFKSSEILHYNGPTLFSHEALLLRDGRVLLSGGQQSRHTAQASDVLLVFDPATKQFSRGMHLLAARVNHSMVQLDDGRVLIIGGNSVNAKDESVPTNTIEVFDPETNEISWFRERLLEPRFGQSAVLLRDGSVLVTGGFTEPVKAVIDSFAVSTDKSTVSASNTAELIYPNGSVYETDYEMTKGRAFHKTSVLETGNVAVFGGTSKHVFYEEDTKECHSCLASSEIYDPERSDFTDTGKSMSAGRVHFDVMPLSNQRVLILGGMGKAKNSSEIFSYNGL